MSRSRRPRQIPPNAPLIVQETPRATINDAAAVVRITDAGVKAMIEATAEYGLGGTPWDPDALHKQIMPVVARALRGTPDWWARPVESCS